jgi:1,4-dihydroxy-2-naphthoate octaprenyltransferase
MFIFRCHLISKGSKCSSSVEKVFHRRFQVQRRNHYLHVELSSSSSSSFEDVGEEFHEDVSMETLIWRAIKLPIYSVALVPLTVSISTILLFFLVGRQNYKSMETYTQSEGTGPGFEPRS